MPGYLPEGCAVTLHAENGILGVGPFPYDDEAGPDLVDAGKQTVTVLMDPVTKKGHPKLLESCTLPLTGKGVVNRLITDLAVLDVADGRFHLVELGPEVTFADVEQRTGAPTGDRRPGSSRLHPQSIP